MRLGGLLLLPVLLMGQVKFRSFADRLEVTVDGKAYTALFFGPEERKPYLHPLRSASGRIVSRQYPMAEIPGEARDHPHHQGLSFTYADVNGYNFWASDASQLNDKTGSIRLNRIVGVEEGDRSGSARVLFDWVKPQGGAILTEDRTMVFGAGTGNRTIDFDITLRAQERVVFGDTKEGMFNIRLGPGFERMSGSSGCYGEKECWGKRADWMDFSGTVDGEELGVAILDHPGNPSHPTYWHVRAYGLFAANPFGVGDFTGDKGADGSMTLRKGESVRFRYRVLIYSGKTTPDQLARHYSDYAR